MNAQQWMEETFGSVDAAQYAWGNNDPELALQHMYEAADCATAAVKALEDLIDSDIEAREDGISTSMDIGDEITTEVPPAEEFMNPETSTDSDTNGESVADPAHWESE